MKKLLSILAAIGLTATSATTVVACSSSKKGDSSKTVDGKVVDKVQNDSLNFSKSLIIDKEYGLDVDATNKVTGLKAENNFDLMDSNSAKSLGINGHTGEENGSIYNIVDIINGLIHQFSPSTKPLSLDNGTANIIAQVIKVIAPMLNSNTLDAAMRGLPGLFETATQALKELGAVQKTISWLGTTAAKLLKDLIGDLNFPSHIADMLKNANTMPNDDKFDVGSVQWFMEQGANALTNLGTEIFNKYSVDSDSDNALSKLLGQEVFTKLLNKQNIDISKSFDYVHLGLYSVDIAYNVATFLTSIVIQMNAYQPIKTTADKPIADAQHLFGDGSQTNSDYFASVDKGTVAVDDKGNVTLAGKTLTLSLDKTFGDMFDDITSNDKTQYGLLKLTNELFHNWIKYTAGTGVMGNTTYTESGQNNPLLVSLLSILIDSFKFTDYEVKSSGLKEGTPDGGNGIITNLDFNIKDLFVPNKQIPVGTAFTNAMGAPMNFDAFIMTADGKFMNRLTTGISPLLSDVLTGKDYSSTDPTSEASGILFQQFANITGLNDDNQQLIAPDNIWVGMRLDGTDDNGNPVSDPTATIAPAGGYLSLAGSTVWPILQPIINNLVYDIYYTDDKPNSLKTLSKGKVDLVPADYINDKVKHLKVGGVTIDLTVVRQLISLDTIGVILKDALIQNSVQDNADGTDSLLSQLINNIDDYKSWDKYLGFIEGSDKDTNIKSNGWTSDDVYVQQDSLIGSILTDMYDLNSDANKAVILTNSVNKLSAIDVSQFDKNNIIGTKTKILSGLVNNFVNGLKGADISGIVNPLYSDDKLWKIGKRTFKGSADGSAVLSMTYELTLDPSSAKISDLDGNKITTPVTYKVTFSRDKAKDNFKFTKLDKVS